MIGLSRELMHRRIGGKALCDCVVNAVSKESHQNSYKQLIFNSFNMCLGSDYEDYCFIQK